ncbi:MAG: hypothetical protein KJ956_13875, partial [Actinobacteria bacterium]|nr:hypothetical protein [Actinomycetota bacterium]
MARKRPLAAHILACTISRRPLVLLPFLSITLLCLPALLSAGEVETVDGVRHVRNGAEPSDGTRTLHLEVLWRVNVEQAEVLVGVLSDVSAGPDGTVWLSDRQLGQVHVYSAGGAYLRSLSREGDGPGELRAPDGLLWLPDGSLGITDRKPCQITRLDASGIPLPSLQLRSSDGEPLGFGDISGAMCRGRTLAICGTEFHFDGGVSAQSRFFGIYDLAGGEICRLLEAPSGFDFETRSYDEAKNYFIDQGNWTVDDGGRVHFAPQRNRYLIHVHD